MDLPTSHTSDAAAPTVDAATPLASRRTGLLISVAASAMVGLNAITAKYAQEALHPLTFVPLWYVVAWTCATVYLIVARIPVREPLRRQWMALVGIGILHGTAATTGFWGLHLLDPTVASFFTRSSVLFIWLLGLIVMGERPTRLALVGTVVAVAGVGVLSYATARLEPAGVVLCLVSAVAMAFGTMVGKQVVAGHRTALMVWVRSGTIAVIVGLISAVTGTFHFVPSWPHLTVLAVGAIIGPFGAQLLFFYSLRYIALSEAGVVRATTPVFVAVYSLVFLGLFPSLQQLAGGAAVVAGALILAKAAPARGHVDDPTAHDAGGS